MSFFKSVSRIPIHRAAGIRIRIALATTRSLSAGFRAYNDSNGTTFQTLKDSEKLDSTILKALNKAGFRTLTPVQEQSMVPILEEEKGIVCRAKTGTGKTLAFVVPTLQSVFQQQVPGKATAVIIAPTRDLALQIETEYKKIISNLQYQQAKNTRVMTFIGGRKTVFDRRSRPSIIVATPGRLQDLLQNNRYFFEAVSDVTYRVYDEADRLLDQGFEETLEDINDLLYDARKKHGTNPDSQFKSVLFSATVDQRVDSFARNTIGSNYKFVNCVDENEPEAHENIHQTLVSTDSIYESHISTLSFILKNLKRNDFKAILFIPTVAGTDCIFDILKELKYNDVFESNSRARLYRLHGKMSQGARDRTVRDFRQAKNGVLICTDVAARGLDFSDVSDVLQFTPSREVADYIHKVGRTARAGAKGNATLFLSKSELTYIRALQKQRGVTFAQTIEYDTLEQDEAAILRALDLDETVLEEYTKSLLGFYKGVSGALRFDFNDMVDGVVNCYRSFNQDPTMKLDVSHKFIQNVLAMSPSTASAYFTVPGGFRLDRSANSRRSKMDFLDYSKNRNGRNAGRSYGRQSFDRNSSKSYNRDRNYDRNNRGEGRFSNRFNDSEW